MGKSNPKYPIYVISKGRWQSRYTIKSLEYMRVPYRVVIEPQERELYECYVHSSKILELPFSNLGLGSIPARNWLWEHSLGEGYARHWVLDDNIKNFYRLNRNQYSVCATGAIFRAIEDFSDRYENVALSGPQYRWFAPRKSKHDPFALNTRIYSCILIKNDIPYRWRGRYNEDTDLSLRALKDGWCTILFYAFLQDKSATMTVKGGNTKELYAGDGRLKMAQSLVDQHPDVCRISRKWNRYQHHVDYTPFENNELKKIDPSIDYGSIDEYEMVIQQSSGVGRQVRGINSRSILVND